MSCQPASIVDTTNGREDRLTGLANRVEFDSRLAGVVEAVNAGGSESVGVLVLDVDHLKSFNDTYGHRVADQLLQGIARTMQATSRPRDLIVRYRGGEFALLLLGYTAGETYLEGERMRQAVETARLQTQAGELSVTVSGGAAVVRPTCAPGALEDLMGTVAEALRDAKAAGRNRICMVG